MRSAWAAVAGPDGGRGRSGDDELDTGDDVVDDDGVYSVIDETMVGVMMQLVSRFEMVRGSTVLPSSSQETCTAVQLEDD